MLDGYVMEDFYREHSIGDSRLWMELFILAERKSEELCCDLMYLRGCGCVLERSDKFGFVIRPVIGPNAWHHVEDYNREKVCLEKNREVLLTILKELAQRERDGLRV